MKVLSLKQPYANLVVSGKKTIELRKWNTKFRGKFLIHASKNIDKKAMEKFGFKNLPQGCIIGETEIVDVKKYANENDCDKDKEKHLASAEWGSYGFILKNAKKFDKPISASGKLGFWNFDKEL